MKRIRKKYDKGAILKIDSLLYEQIKEFVKVNKLQYPSIKNFVEQSVMHSLGFKKYNLGGANMVFDDGKTLKEIVGVPTGKYAICAICSNAFFKEKTDESGVCLKCSSAIGKVVSSIKEKKERKRKSKLNKIIENN